MGSFPTIARPGGVQWIPERDQKMRCHILHLLKKMVFIGLVETELCAFLYCGVYGTEVA